MGKSKKGKANKSNADGGDDLVSVDPARVRFQHARIRPHFSGCGRSVVQTLDDIREGKLKPEDLPPIQVLVGPKEDGQRWYFALNNRRLWVLKRCREEGLLENDQIRVRVRQPKSNAESERYTLKNCAVEAKFMREPQPKQKLEVAAKKVDENTEEKEGQLGQAGIDVLDGESGDDSDDDDDNVGKNSNPFSALM
jgi:hypothetical protein